MIVHLCRLAFSNLRRSPWRSLLILQGIIWGSALAIAPPAIIRGSLDYAEKQALEAGTNRILISQDTMSGGKPFAWDTALKLLETFPELEAGTGLSVIEDADIPIIIVGPGSLAARGQTLAEGRDLDDDDFSSESRETYPALVESKAAYRHFSEPGPLRSIVTVGGKTKLEVVGVLESRPGDMRVDSLGYSRDHPLRGLLDEISEYLGFFGNAEEAFLTSDDGIIAPHSAFPEVAPEWIELRAPPPAILDLKKRLGDYLSSEGYEPLITAHAVLSVLYGETVNTMMEMNRIIFAMAILVGTTVVCVLMILTVMERQREIAIRRVEGARQWHIGLQFTVETGVLCAIGGALGIPLGLFLAFIRCKIEVLSSVTWTIPWPEAFIVFSVVTASGLLGGLLPAWRATRVDPVVILRTE